MANDWQEILDTQDDWSCRLQVAYSDVAGAYKVEVSRDGETLSEQFSAAYPPNFYMELPDNDQAMQIYEKLSGRLALNV